MPPISKDMAMQKLMKTKVQLIGACRKGDLTRFIAPAIGFNFIIRFSAPFSNIFDEYKTGFTNNKN